MGDSKTRITAETLVEDILDIPGVITFCIGEGFSPYQCSGSYPCSLGKLLATRNIPDPDGFIERMNAFVEEKGE
ncbi:hypothetical protein [Pseudodesulfovibrio sp.]|uniref:hypothetical protein n=1 Tax=unclassified Pseudodesulfovibrio TaxID=2661612 RepID=UPI003AFF9CFC